MIKLSYQEQVRRHLYKKYRHIFLFTSIMQYYTLCTRAVVTKACGEKAAALMNFINTMAQTPSSMHAAVAYRDRRFVKAVQTLLLR